MDKKSRVKLHTGNYMPIIGLGTWQLTKGTAGTIVHALELGYSLIDTSSDYGTQGGIGEGIRKSGIDRRNIYLTTKVEETDDAYDRAKSNLEELGVDFVDLMLIHRPPSEGAGIGLWEGLIRAKKEGLVRDIGVSNYSIELMEELVDATGTVPTVNQIEWSPFGHSRLMKKYCDGRNIIIQAYSPLTRTKRLGDETLARLAEKYEKTPAQILIRWNLELGTVPIPKANKKEHLEENIHVFDFEITDSDMKMLAGLNEEYSSLGSLPYVGHYESHWC